MEQDRPARLSSLFERIRMMHADNSMNVKRGFRLAEVSESEALSHAQDELTELRQAPDDIDEMADVVAILIHYCIIKKWDEKALSEAIHRKLDLRFETPPDDDDPKAKLAAASNSQIIEMLYDRAIRDLKRASVLIGSECPETQDEALNFLSHAQQIIAELNHCLNMNDENQLAKNLSRIYEYAQSRLTEAPSKRDSKPIDEVVGLLNELHDSWKTIARPQD